MHIKIHTCHCFSSVLLALIVAQMLIVAGVASSPGSLALLRSTLLGDIGVPSQGIPLLVPRWITEVAGSDLGDRFGVLRPSARCTTQDGNERLCTRTEVMAFTEEALANREEFLEAHPEFLPDGDVGVSLSGIQHIRSSVVIPVGVPLRITPGSVLRMSPNISILSYAPVLMKGEEGNPIIIESEATHEPWGTFAVLHTGEMSKIQWVEASGGSSASIHGVHFPGMLSFYGSSVIMGDSKFTGAQGEAALSLEYAASEVKRVRIERSKHNGMSVIHAVGAELADITVLESGKSGIVLSWSPVALSHVTIEEAAGACMRISNQATPVLQELTLRNCPSGLEIRDDAHVTVRNAIFENVQIAIDADVSHTSQLPPSVDISNATFFEVTRTSDARNGAMVRIGE